MDPLDSMSMSAGPIPKDFDAENAENNEDVSFLPLPQHQAFEPN